MKKTLVVTLALGSLASANAAVLIDHFDAPPGGQAVGRTTPGTSTFSLGGLPVLGGFREIELDLATVGTGGAAEASANLLGDNFQLANTVNADSKAEVRYGSSVTLGAPGPLNQDFSSCTSIVLDDLGSDLPSTWFVYLVDGTGASHAEIIIHPGGGGTMDYFLPLGLFGALDLTDIDGIILGVDTPTGGDAQLHRFAAVPEPNAAAIVGGLLGLGMLYRRFRAA